MKSTCMFTILFHSYFVLNKFIEGQGIPRNILSLIEPFSELEHLRKLQPDTGSSKTRNERKLTEMNPVCNSERSITSGPNALINKLTDSDIYDLTIRPNVAYHPSRPIPSTPDYIFNRIVVNDIVNLDELTQSLSTSFYDMFMWQDVRLAYNTTGNGACVVPAMNPYVPSILLNVDQISEGVDQIIWIPSTLTINVQNEHTGMGVGFVFPDGSVATVKQKEMKTACTMHFGQYPFDEHSCSIDVSTLGQSDSDVTLMPGEPMGSGQLIDTMLLTESSYEVGEFFATEISTSSFKALFNGISGVFKFKRNTHYFATHVLLPDLLLHLSIYCGFWIDASNAQARVAICIISGLSFRILMASISAKLPSVTYSIWVVDFMIASQFLSVLCLIHYGFVAFFLSVEHVRLRLLDGFKKSQIPKLLREGATKPSTIFEQAELKYKDFLESAKFACKQKTKLKKGDKFVSKLFPNQHYHKKSKIHPKHVNKEEDIYLQMKKEKMLEMIKIEENDYEDFSPLPRHFEYQDQEHKGWNKAHCEEEVQSVEDGVMRGNMTFSPATQPDRTVSETSSSNMPSSNQSPYEHGTTFPAIRKEVTVDMSSNDTSSSSLQVDMIPGTPVQLPPGVHPEEKMKSHRVSISSGAQLKESLKESFMSMISSPHMLARHMFNNTSQPDPDRSFLSHRSLSNMSELSTAHNSTRNSVDNALVMLTTYEVMTIAYVKEAFGAFDTGHNGVLTVQELKMCFRAFGKYYTTNQVCALVEAFRTSQRSSLGRRPTLHFVDFFCLLVELELHEPLPEFTTRDYLAIPPSLILDLLMRVFFPLIVGVKIWVCFWLLDTY